MYVLQLFDYYASNGGCIVFLCVFEILALGWLFGRYDVIVVVVVVLSSTDTLNR